MEKMTTCEACENPISRMATACPKCGHPHVPKRPTAKVVAPSTWTRTILRWVAAFAVIIGVCSLLAWRFVTKPMEKPDGAGQADRDRFARTMLTNAHANGTALVIDSSDDCEASARGTAKLLRATYPGLGFELVRCGASLVEMGGW